MWCIVGVVFIAILFSALIIVLAIVAWEAPLPEHTTAGAMADIHEISDRTLKVRAQILHSQLPDRLSIADELLYISDDARDAANRLHTCAFMDAAMFRQGGIS